MATPPKRTPRLMTVTAKRWVTPTMIRVTCAADWMKDLTPGIEGAHFKIFLPKPDQSAAAFAEQLETGPRPDVRTYTIRFLRALAGEMDIDFVDHGDAGPASAWARRRSATRWEAEAALLKTAMRSPPTRRIDSTVSACT